MANRITGMYSGLDTESLIKDLVKAKSSKVESLKKEKTKAEWKQEAWSSLNTKIKNFFSKTVNSMKYSSDYSIKKTTSSNTSAVSVITGAKAMNSVQTLSIKQLASTGYLTGGKVTSEDNSAISGSTKVSEIMGDSFASGSFSITAQGKTTDITIDADTTVDSLVSKLNQAGVSANFDTVNQRFFIGAKASGEDNDFTITANGNTGLNIMKSLGLHAKLDDKTKASYQESINLAKKISAVSAADICNNPGSELNKLFSDLGVDTTDESAVQSKMDELIAKGSTADKAIKDAAGGTAVKLIGQDAIIELNGAEFKSSTNNIEVNGLTFTCLAVADDITVTTQDDTDGLYDKIKNFFKEYNELINEMDKLLNTSSKKGYDVLSDDEKSAMTDKEVEKWEDTLKESLLHNDDNLEATFNGMKDTLSAGIKIGDKTYYLSDFGINTPAYLESSDYERSAYHIDGDKDDSVSSGKDDVLKTLIANNSDLVIEYFSTLSNNLYSKMNELSGSSNYSSFGSFYDDKKYKTDMSDLEKKIAEAEEKLADYEDKWYSKFSAMETALAKLDSSNQYISNLFS